MGIAKKISEWQLAGLLNEKQAVSILAYEHMRKGGRFMTGLIAVSLFAILCGVLSIVAANWMDIPAEVKLGVHISLNTLIACALYYASKPLYREGLCLLLFGLTLTLIALIGQVFQLGGSWANALILWLTITAPLMLAFAQTRINAVPWVVAFLVTIFVVLEEYLPDPTAVREVIIMIGLAAFLPLALIADGNMDAVQKHKPVWGAVFVRTGFVLLVLGATLASLIWYCPLAREYTIMSTEAGWHAHTAQLAAMLILIAAIAAQIIYGALKNFYKDDEQKKAAGQVAFLSTLFTLAPLAVAVEWGGIAATLHIILYWVAFGYIAQTQGWNRLVSFTILVLSVRIFIAYCELFGDLLTTGYALIIGGAVMLGLIWSALRLNKYLKRKSDAVA